MGKQEEDRSSPEVDAPATGDNGQVDSKSKDPEGDGSKPTDNDSTRDEEALDSTEARLKTVSKAYTELQEEMGAIRHRLEFQGKLKMEREAFELVQKFFEPVTNLKRSLNMDGTGSSEWVDGLRMVHGQFMDVLRQLGLEAVPGEGSAFDPNYHEALAISEVDSAADDGKVIMVHSEGYAVKGKVIKAAQVVVGKYSKEPSEE